jgi:hypothetical protein
VSRRVPDGGGPPGPADLALADTVAALRDEISGLRSAARTRAVIEQAKGVLVERHHISLEEAFGRLRTMSQEHNVRLVEVAATVIGVAVPEIDPLPSALPDEVLRDQLPRSLSASQSWSALQQQPDVRAGVLTALIDSVAGTTRDGDEAAALLRELLEPEGVTAVTMFRTSADESLRLVGHIGVPGDVISSWRSIPPSRDIPYVVSAQDGRAFFWRDRTDRGVDFPALSAARSAFVATATVPVSDDGSVVGVVGLMWGTVEEFDGGRIDAITRTVQRVCPLLLRNAAAADPELEWLNTVLRLHLDPWLLLEAIPGADGVIRDFVVQDATQTMTKATDWFGRRLLEIWPFLAADGVAQALSGLARSGGSWTMTVAIGSPAPWGLPGSRIRAVRLGSRIVLVWRPGRESDRRSLG